MYAAIAAAVVVLFVCRAPLLDRVYPAGVQTDLSLETLRLGPKPNQYLVLPRGWGAEQPHRESPVFDFSADELKRRWDAVAAASPRTLRLSADTVATRSWFWRFPDLVTVAFIPLTEDSSAIAVYSRALYGYSDLGKNKKRIDAWLSALKS